MRQRASLWADVVAAQAGRVAAVRHPGGVVKRVPPGVEPEAVVLRQRRDPRLRGDAELAAQVAGVVAADQVQVTQVVEAEREQLVEGSARRAGRVLVTAGVVV